MIQNIQQWTEFTFHICNLGDKRRTDRLVKMVCGLAKNGRNTRLYRVQIDAAKR